MGKINFGVGAIPTRRKRPKATFQNPGAEQQNQALPAPAPTVQPVPAGDPIGSAIQQQRDYDAPLRDAALERQSAETDLTRAQAEDLRRRRRGGKINGSATPSPQNSAASSLANVKGSRLGAMRASGAPGWEYPSLRETPQARTDTVRASVGVPPRPTSPTPTSAPGRIALSDGSFTVAVDPRYAAPGQLMTDGKFAPGATPDSRVVAAIKPQMRPKTGTANAVVNPARNPLFRTGS